ncbi:prephenate dehydratase [Raineyella antarctica]|uniref:Prephenate dehydratase n=1 Tax=Raineyella antarctica TaxID=1577474 RepID=A0A1G6GFZ9_9ACTN|nr:prephenate dehydratase [Raineyella antarctica]SDB80917.1 prephenate dehydratase [Raineyella antarctica]
MPSLSYGYFGPPGTFTHQALLLIAGEEDRLLPFRSVVAALDAVRAGEIDAAFVPIENSLEGGVSATLDYLADDSQPLMIRREVLLPVQFALCVRPGTVRADIRSVLTHPHAAAQTRLWVARHLPRAVVTEGPSTAGAAVEVSDPDSAHDAAICARIAGEMNGLEILADGIADNEDAVTRFVVVTSPAPPPPATGADKTTLVAYMRVDRSGSLLGILEQIAGHGVNMTRIESRPTKQALGSYCFSIDAEGHLDDPRMQETLTGLHRVCSRVTFLGSYPRADRQAPILDEGQTNEAYAEAQAWLQGLRYGG